MKESKILLNYIDSIKSELKNRSWIVKSFPEELNMNISSITNMCDLLDFNSSKLSSRNTVWPIQSKEYGKSFSSLDGIAPLHSDSQYLENPENLILLACVRPAKMGGKSVILTIDDFLRTLRKDNFSTEEIKILKEPNWRWKVPKDFIKDLGYEVTNWSPILLNNKMRWKFSNLEAKSKSILKLSRKIEDSINKSEFRTIYKLKKNEILFCKNQELIHGRTDFNDNNRLLIRGRVNVGI